MAKQPETKFKEKVAKDLKTLPLTYFLKTQERARRGVPDYLICLKGLFVAIELKVEGKTADALQAVTLEKIRQAKGIAFESTPNQWPMQFEMLKDILGREGIIMAKKVKAKAKKKK